MERSRDDRIVEVRPISNPGRGADFVVLGRGKNAFLCDSADLRQILNLHFDVPDNAAEALAKLSGYGYTTWYNREERRVLAEVSFQLGPTDEEE